MAKPEDMEELAAEFALGSLPPEERREAESLMASDPAFAGMVTGVGAAAYSAGPGA